MMRHNIMAQISGWFAALAVCHLTIAPPLRASTESGGHRPAYFIRSASPQHNLIFDDKALSAVLDMRRGIIMPADRFNLVAEEIKAFYAAHGFTKIKVALPRRTEEEGALSVVIDEREELKNPASERRRAEVTVERLLAAKKLALPAAQKEEAIVKLHAAYKTRRLAEAALTEQRMEEQRARVRAALENKRAMREAEKSAYKDNVTRMRERVTSWHAEGKLPLK